MESVGGQPPMEPEEGLWVNRARNRAGYGSWLLPLTASEVAVLATLIEARGRLVSRPELARRSGLQHASARRTDSLLVALRRALGPSAVRTVRRRGWILDPEAIVVREHGARRGPASCEVEAGDAA